MPKIVEVDEAELMRLHKLQTTVGTLLSDPKTKLELQRIVKAKFPDAVTPELDAQQAGMSEIEKLRKEISDERTQREKDESEREEKQRIARLTTEFEDGFKKLRTQGYTDHGIAEIRKIMEDKGIMDHDLAAAYFEKVNPPQNPIRPGRAALNLFEPDDSSAGAETKRLLELKGDDNGIFVDKMVDSALAEIRGQPRR